MDNQNNQPTPPTDSTTSKPILYRHNEYQSLKSRMLKFALRWYEFKAGRGFIRKIETGKPSKLDVPEPPIFMTIDFKVTSLQILERNVYRLKPKATKPSNKVILFLHGGGYFDNATKFHWKFLHQLMRDSDFTVIHPDYPLGPQNSHIECFQFMDTLYNSLLSEINPNDLIFMGDSAGAGLALAFCQKLKLENRPQPSQLILISPWLDVSCTNPEMLEVDKHDPLINIEAIQRAGRLWAKDIDVNHFLVSPVNGDVEGLPKISIFTSNYDVLEPDTRKFKEKSEQKGVSINYFEYPKMIHDWILFGLPESTKAIQQIKSLL